jgi:hypothetical protein
MARGARPEDLTGRARRGASGRGEKRRTLGYVVFRMAGTQHERTAVVVDYLAPPRLVAPMLLAAAGEARRQGAIALSVKTRNEPADRYLRLAGFLRRDRGADAPIRFMVHCTAGSDLCGKVSSPASWFVTSADCDLEYGMTPSDEGDDVGSGSNASGDAGASAGG